MTGVFLARFWGLYILIVILGLLLRRKTLMSIFKIYKNEETIVLGGVFTVLIGLFLVLFYNVWEMNWRGIVTLLGWATLIKGLMLFFFPEMMRTWAGKIIKWKLTTQFLLIVTLVFGMYLTYVGFTQ